MGDRQKRERVFTDVNTLPREIGRGGPNQFGGSSVCDLYTLQRLRGKKRKADIQEGLGPTFRRAVTLIQTEGKRRRPVLGGK